MYTSEYDYLLKLLLIGDSGVGKSHRSHRLHVDIQNFDTAQNIVLRTHWTQRNSNTATRNWRRRGYQKCLGNKILLREQG
ncbi:uncharacterized protein C8Q71DRAFT_854772 [Rhodofomes roseus]|uniref:Tr-type G domain-containing protein n=1 Tax=Rhodofomes roseus TaxID=34475 RepID=A0ABQ8KQL1_9APHY|nr:uncharacterized protein C8Q71DRAFT_854772 [Rhodofomes roseus]KAH9840923.1 hypothetical protein C8Q71DRAFT_854772 [Rhodofomes roseus]